MSVFDSLAERRDPVDAPLRELARLVRVEAATARRAEEANADAHRARAEARRLEREHAEMSERTEALEERLAALEAALREAEEREAEAANAQKQRGVRKLLAREGKSPPTEG